MRAAEDLYVVGTATAGTQDRFEVFIENSHDHAGRWPLRWPPSLHRARARPPDPRGLVPGQCLQKPPADPLHRPLVHSHRAQGPVETDGR